MKKIIVPVDFSDASLDALRVAADISRTRKGIVLHLVHTYERPVSGIALQFEIDHPKMKEVRKFIKTKLEDLTKKSFMRDVPAEIHILADKEVWEFYRDVKLKDADLIVMGTHGVKGWRTAFIGSNTHKVVQTSHIPVLAIKEHKVPFQLKNVVFASDFMDNDDGDFDRIKPLIDLYDARVHLLRVNTRNHFETTWSSRWAMEAFAKKHELKKYTTNIFNDESVEEGILHFANTVENDMIVMETHGRTDFRQLFNPSIAERVVNMVWKPVLSVLISKESRVNPYLFREKRDAVHAKPVPGGLIV